MIGIGLRAPHVDAIGRERPALDFLEVHPENYMPGGPALDRLLDIRRDYAVSLHGVGLSPGSAEGIDLGHLARLKDLVGRVEPMLISEHLSWSVAGGRYLNDLLPLPYTEEALRIVARNVARIQDHLGRRILIENPSRYLAFRHSTLSEAAFLSALVDLTGCGLLLDVNNVYVSAQNLGEDADAFFAGIPAAAVGEIHLAGHGRGPTCLIDDHGAPICDAVWSLYARAVDRTGAVPTLIERDKNIPSLGEIVAEAHRAEGYRHARAA